MMLKTDTLRFNLHPFNMAVPIYINLGVPKKASASSSSNLHP